MLTCCPACRTCFRITEAQLAVAQGKVRCGKCKTVFNAKQHLKPPAGETGSPAREADVDYIDLFTAPPRETEPEPEVIPPKEPEHREVTPKQAAGIPSQPRSEPAEPDREPEQASGATADEAAEQEPGSGDESTASRFEYNVFTDEVLSDKDLDDILAEMNQQLALGIDTAAPEPTDPLLMSDEVEPPVEDLEEESSDTLSQAIDSLFEEFQAGEDLYQESAYARDEEPLSDENALPVETAEIEAGEPATGEPVVEAPGRIDEDDEETRTSDTDSKIETETDTVPFHLRESLAVQPPKPRSRLALFGGALLVLLLLAALVGQLILFRPLDVVRLFPQSQPYLEQICQQVPCHFAPHRAPEQIRMVNRDVRAHPEQKGVLLITATLVNEAGFAQGYPDLQVTLFDLSGNKVARRRFTPEDYLGEGYSPFMQLQPETPLQIKLEVMDPGANAVNFEFDFL